MIFSAPGANVSSLLKSESPSVLWYWVRSSGPFSSMSTCFPAATRRLASGDAPAPLPMTTTATDSSAIRSPPVVRAATERCLDGALSVEVGVPVDVDEAALQVLPSDCAGVSTVTWMYERTDHRMAAQEEQEVLRTV